MLEWRGLNELPRPVLKQLPLEPAATEFGSPGELHPPLKPARIVDEVPADYRGEFYYRIVPSQHGQARNPRSYVRFPAPKGTKLEDEIGQRLALVWPNHAAAGEDMHLTIAPGELHPDFRVPLSASLRARAAKPFAEYTRDVHPLVSARFRRVLEALEPGAHLFLPLDLADGASEPRLYIFFAGVAFRPTAAAIGANGIADLLLLDGGLGVGEPRLCARHFYLLNRALIGRPDVFHDTLLGPLFSHRAVSLLGDVLAREHAFMPVGVCEEPLPARAGKVTRDGAVHPAG